MRKTLIFGLALLGVFAALASGLAHRRQAGRDSSPSAATPGVQLISVKPAENARLAVYTFKNVSKTSVALIYFAKDDDNYNPFTFYSDEYLAPGATFSAVRDASLQHTNYVAAIVYADGTFEGSGLIATKAATTHKEAIRALARFSKTIEDAQLAGVSNDVAASRLAAQIELEALSHKSLGAEIIRRYVQIVLNNEGARGVGKLSARMRAINRITPLAAERR